VVRNLWTRIQDRLGNPEILTGKSLGNRIREVDLVAEPREPTLANTARVGHPNLLLGEESKDGKYLNLEKQEPGFKSV
jgi:hypothetical protein